MRFDAEIGARTGVDRRKVGQNRHAKASGAYAAGARAESGQRIAARTEAHGEDADLRGKGSTGR